MKADCRIVGRPDQAQRRSGRCLPIAGTALRLVRPTDSTLFLKPAAKGDLMEDASRFSSQPIGEVAFTRRGNRGRAAEIR